MIDDQEAIKSLKGIDDKGKSTAQKFGDVAKKGAVIGTALVGAGVAAGGALLGMAKKSAEVTDNIDKMSQKIGLSREGYQEWNFIMSQSGMSVDQLQTGLKTMVTAVDQAIDGAGKGAESFDKLGISVHDANGNVKDQETIFNEAVIALQGMEEGTEKAKLANDLFGKSGSEMMPLLNGAAGSVEEMKEKAHELGLVLGDDTIDAGVAFTDSMDQVQRMLGAVGTKVGAEVMPIVQKMLEWFVAHMPQIQAVASKAFGVIGDVLTVTVDLFKAYLLPVFQSLYDWVQANMPMIKEVVKQAFDTIKEVWETTLKPAFESIMSVLGVVWEIFKVAWPHIMDVVGVAFTYIKQLWETVLQPTFAFIFDIVQQLVTKFQEHMPVIENTFKVMADTIKWAYDTIIKPAIDLIAIAVGWLRDKFTEYILPLVGSIMEWFSTIATTMQSKIEWARDKVSGAINSIKGFFEGVATARDTVLGIFDSIKNGIQEKIEWARDKVNNAIEAIKGFFNFEFSLPHIPTPSFGISPSGWKIGDLLKGSIPSLDINWNAKGGIFDTPTIFNTNKGLQGVGEAGAEAVLPLNTKTYAGMGKGIADALAKMTQPQQSNDTRPIVLQIDGKTFAQITGDYYGNEGGNRIRRIERGLAQA